MKKKNLKKIIWILIISIIIILYVLSYLSFIRINDIDAGAYWGHNFNNSIREQIQEKVTCIKLHLNSLFIRKGDTYKNITFLDKDSIQHEMDIKFNWDNSITIYNDTSEFNLYVDRVTFDEKIRFIDESNPYKPLCSVDSFFIGFNIYDKNNNYIVVYRQSEKMYYGKHRIGFEVQINGDSFYTGTRHFNY